MGKRIFLFVLTNIMVIATLSIVTSVLGLHNYLTARGIDYQSLIVFCSIWGMGGAFISLLLSKWMAKFAMGVRVLEIKTANPTEAELMNKVHALARNAGLTTMPEVGIYNSPEVNAFATGPSRNNALVAVSTGLLAQLNAEEVSGVIGHEVAHIANGDMVTLTLIQGVVNAFAMFLSRIAAYAVSMMLSKNDDRESSQPTMIYFLLTFVFDILFTFLGSLVVAAFSRYREFRADAGGAKLAGKNLMIAALTRLKAHSEIEDKRGPALAALKINRHSSWLALLSTHPSLEARITRLQQASENDSRF